MADIFLSYAHEDAVIADRVRQVLLLAGFNVVSDKVMRPGGSVSGTLTRALEDADGFVALLSRKYLESGWSQFELASAFVSDASGARRPLVPVLVDPELKLRDLPPVLFDVQWLDARRGVNENDLRSVIEVLQSPSGTSAGHEGQRSEVVLDLRERVLRQQEAALKAEQTRRDQGLKVSLVAGLLAVVISIGLTVLFVGTEAWGVGLASLFGALLSFLATLPRSMRSRVLLGRRRRG